MERRLHLSSLLLQYRLIAKREQRWLPFLGKKAGPVWVPETAWWSQMPSQISNDSRRNLPEPSARHGRDPSGVHASTCYPPRPLSSPLDLGPHLLGPGAWHGTLCLLLSEHEPSLLLKELHAWTKRPRHQWCLGSKTKAATSEAGVALRPAQSLGSQPPTQDRMVWVSGYLRKYLQTGPIVQRRTRPPSVPRGLAKPQVSETQSG